MAMCARAREGNDQIDRSAADQSGEFVSGMMNGKAKINYPDGAMFEGQWITDEKNSKAILCRNSGSEVHGLWENDELNRNWDDDEKSEFKKGRPAPRASAQMDEHGYVDNKENGSNGASGSGRRGLAGTRSATCSWVRRP
jgi:hypothetical protein